MILMCSLLLPEMSGKITCRAGVQAPRGARNVQLMGTRNPTVIFGEPPVRGQAMRATARAALQHRAPLENYRRVLKLSTLLCWLER